MNNNRTLLIMTGVVLLSFAIIIAINLLPLFSNPTHTTYLSPNEVRGMALEHHQLLYTLNFNQQNQVLEYLNQALPTAKNRSLIAPLEKPDFEKLIIYRFNKPDIEITPIGYAHHNLIFQSKTWSEEGYFIEISGGLLETLLSNTFDL